MNDMRRNFSGSIMFITHDLGVVASMADDVTVMYHGKIVESAPVRALFRTPLHPYTQGLLRSAPSISGPNKGRLATIEGSVPHPTAIIHGCSFASRCGQAKPVCRSSVPALIDVADRQKVACFLHHSVVGDSANAS